MHVLTLNSSAKIRSMEIWSICRFSTPRRFKFPIHLNRILEYPWTWLITSHVTRGPNWIHGTDSNPILDLAKETRTLTMSWDGRQAVFDQHGNPLSDEEAAEATEIVWDTIEEAMKYSNDHSASIPAEKSLYEYFEEKVQQLFPDSQPDDKEAQRKRTRILQKAEMWGAFVGSPVQTQSLKFFWLEECIDGENLFVAETYQKVLEKIAAPALTSTDTRFKSKVTRILSNVNADEPRVTLETESGDKASFDEVVVTAPLGWLKRHRDAFVPQIPKRLEQAIESIGYGHLDKVLPLFQ